MFDIVQSVPDYVSPLIFRDIAIHFYSLNFIFSVLKLASDRISLFEFIWVLNVPHSVI